jgi:cytochrome c biogenesis protein CcmG, thiol:disulfide interchange protein DsbE
MRLRVLALAIALTVMAGCTGGAPRSSSSMPPATLPSSPDALPQFGLAGFQQILSGLRGKPVVVNIWASWCGPCQLEAPALAKMARETQSKAQFVGVDILDQRTPARAHVHQYGWTFPSVFDPKGAIRDGLGFVGQPVTALYDSSGKRVWVQSGPITESLLREQLHKLRVI